MGRKSGSEIPQSDQESIRLFFEEPYVILVEASREICTKAQGLFWKYPALEWKDVVHVASALKHNIPIMHTFDGPLSKLSGKVGGNPILTIQKPGIGKGPLFGA